MDTIERQVVPASPMPQRRRYKRLGTLAPCWSSAGSDAGGFFWGATETKRTASTAGPGADWAKSSAAGFSPAHFLVCVSRSRFLSTVSLICFPRLEART